MHEIVLYGTKGCHLCDKAERVVRRLAPQFSLQYRYCDIAEDENLLAKFALEIPVVEHSGSQLQLHWPIDDDTFCVFASQFNR